MPIPLVNIISMMAWVFPVIRNKKSKYLTFFVVNALTDPLIFFILIPLKVNSNYLILITDIVFVCFFSYLITKTYKLKIKIILLLLIAVCIGFFEIEYSIMILDLTVLSQILYLMLYDVIKLRKLNLFPFILFLYFLLVSLNSIFVLLNTNTGTFYFNQTLLIMVIFAVFFSIFSDNSKKLIINLKSKSNSHSN